MAGKDLVLASGNGNGRAPATAQYVTMRVGDALVGISVHTVQDVIRYQPITGIPLAQPVVAGAINVRGRIVTALNMRQRLGMGAYPNMQSVMMAVVEQQHELYALMVDAVGDVLTLDTAEEERLPANMDDNWRGIASGVYKLEGELLVILDVNQIIQSLSKGEAA